MAKTVIISGGTSGIGLALAKLYKKEGFNVWCLARNKPADFEFNFVKCDLTKKDEIDIALNEILSQVEKVDILICNAGMGISGPIEHCNLDCAKNMFDVNLFSAFLLSQKIIPHFRKVGCGKIMFISSVGSIFPLPFQAFYSASKCALEALAFALKNEVRPFNIQVSCVLPGDTKTSFTANREKCEEQTPEYKGKDITSVCKMEKDEQCGMSADYVAKIIFKATLKKKMPNMKIIGFKYKMFYLANKILPKRLVLYVVGKMYA